MKLGSFFSLLLILFFTSQCLLQACSAETHRPDRKLFDLKKLAQFIKWPFVKLPPKYRVPRVNPANPAKKYEWVGKVPDLIDVLIGAACDHLVADKGKVSCVKKGFCKLRPSSGICRARPRLCYYKLPSFQAALKVTNLQKTCGDICYIYKYHLNKKSTCMIWIPPIAY